MKKETKTIDSVQYITQYTYDQNGNLKTMTYPSGKVITYNLSNDRVTSVQNGAATIATNISYKPFGGMTSITYGNGITSSIGYDNQYRITSIVTGTIQNLSYSSYDFNGNIQTISNNAEPTKSKTLGYDALERLQTATANGLWGSLGWTYDGVGNRLTENTNNYSYAPGTNKLTSANGISFGYDSNGNTITQSSRVYTYNQNQRLVQVNDGATTAYYTYNSLGQRAKKVVNGVTTVFHYDLRGQLIAESNGAGSITAEYIYLDCIPLAKLEGANAYYYVNDHLSTPQRLMDSTGAVVWSADYKPFGEATITISTITNNLRFSGQYFDAETGLNYNYFRDYNPTTGKYAQADPLASIFLYESTSYFVIPFLIPDTLHTYAYAGQNPVSWIDPFGLQQRMIPPPNGQLGSQPPLVYNPQTGALTRGWTPRIEDPDPNLSKMQIYGWLNKVRGAISLFLKTRIIYFYPQPVPPHMPPNSGACATKPGGNKS